MSRRRGAHSITARVQIGGFILGERFAVYTTRQTQAKYLARWTLFNKVLTVHGNIFECGVLEGQGLMSWANFSAILEPYNHQRLIVGVDTFEGIQELDEKDNGGDNPENKLAGFKQNYDVVADLRASINNFDCNRPIGHMEKVKLLKGKAEDTLPTYLGEHPETMCALLSLDYDIYKPSITTLELLVPRMPKGAIILFDELGNTNWPGETIAAIEYFGSISALEVRRFTYTPTISYVVM